MNDHRHERHDVGSLLLHRPACASTPRPLFSPPFRSTRNHRRDDDMPTRALLAPWTVPTHVADAMIAHLSLQPSADDTASDAINGQTDGHGDGPLEARPTSSLPTSTKTLEATDVSEHQYKNPAPHQPSSLVSFLVPSSSSPSSSVHFPCCLVSCRPR
ncbi:uncharacterized protein B0I36DRAFT_126655 [Microdochium trichocladiopsis]|uniref:Uncharacterized protein n=1 Tax=Microdochium trichocladiopsis TaxID=1682393 RepID=A0A9P9BSH6_9PEZI|nr:uncharacterized protein B0I36DRAFT_126655 [Microdochium trichocladiopsis]KAH7028856.1 hypothetical protein B0I36DRAFT_126655 [Microdochium trichocladiopsis]